LHILSFTNPFLLSPEKTHSVYRFGPTLKWGKPALGRLRARQKSSLPHKCGVPMPGRNAAFMRQNGAVEEICRAPDFLFGNKLAKSICMPRFIGSFI
jgi:hypothetical protein